MAKKKAAAKKVAAPKAAKKAAAPKAPAAKKPQFDEDGNELPPVYRLDRGESLPPQEPWPPTKK